MALVKCKECGKEISDTAERCPSCGCVTNHGQEQKEAKSFLVLYALDFVALGVGLLLLLGGNWSIGLILTVSALVGMYSTNKHVNKFLKGEKETDRSTDVRAIMEELNIPYGEAEMIAKKRTEERKSNSNT